MGGWFPPPFSKWSCKESGGKELWKLLSSDQRQPLWASKPGCSEVAAIASPTLQPQTSLLVSLLASETYQDQAALDHPGRDS